MFELSTLAASATATGNPSTLLDWRFDIMNMQTLLIRCFLQYKRSTFPVGLAENARLGFHWRLPSPARQKRPGVLAEGMAKRGALLQISARDTVRTRLAFYTKFVAQKVGVMSFTVVRIRPNYLP